MTQMILYAGARPSIWGRFRTHGLATVRATIWIVSLFAQWFLYATLLNSLWRLAGTCMKLSTYSAGFLSMLVGTDTPASTPTSTAPAAAATTLDAILTLVRRTAAGNVDPLLLFDGKMTPLFATGLDFSAANLVDRASTFGPTPSVRGVLGGLVKGCLMVAGIFVVSTVVKSLRAAVEALRAEKKHVTDVQALAETLIHKSVRDSADDADFESVSNECIYNMSMSAATDSGSEQELSGVTLAPPCTPSGSLSDLKSIASAEAETCDKKFGSSPSFNSQAKTQTTPALNPSAPVFKPRAPPMLKRRPAVLNLSQPTTPRTDSAASTPGPVTPTSPSPAPAPIPTHFTRRPPVTPRRSGPTVGDVKPRSRVFAPVVRGPDGLVRVLAPGGVPLVVEPAVVAADMFYRA